MPGGAEAARAGQFNATQWRDPVKVANYLRGNTVTEHFIAGLRAGGSLWFPTKEQALEVAAPLYAAWEQNAAETAALRRQQGSITAFT